MFYSKLWTNNGVIDFKFKDSHRSDCLTAMSIKPTSQISVAHVVLSYNLFFL